MGPFATSGRLNPSAAASVSTVMAFLVIVLVVAAGLGLFALGRIDLWLHDRRSARRDRYSLDWLQAHTGIASHAEVEALVGPPGADCLYHVPPERLRSLPRARWWAREPGHAALDAVAVIALAVGAGTSLREGSPAWAWLAPPMAYLALEIGWGIAWLVLFDPEDPPRRGVDPDVPDLDGASDLRTGVAELGRTVDELIEDSERRRAEDRRDGSLPPLLRLLVGLVTRWELARLRRDRHEVRELEDGLADDLADARRNLVRIRWRIGELVGPDGAPDDPAARERLRMLRELDERTRETIESIDASAAREID